MHIYITRHGESINNIKGIIGGDCHITEKGIKYGDFLNLFFKDNHNNSNITIWTSKLIRTIETASRITENKHIQWESLNEIYAGDFDNFTLDKIKKEYPVLYNFRNNNKLHNSYPNGESYIDVQKRVYKLLDSIDLNQKGTLLIISHKAVSRVIHSYFTKTPINTSLEIKLNTLYKLEDDYFVPIYSKI